jgi:hypothetical protein
MPCPLDLRQGPGFFVLSPCPVGLPAAIIGLILDLVIELNGDRQRKFWRQQAVGSFRELEWTPSIGFPVVRIIGCNQMNPTAQFRQRLLCHRSAWHLGVIGYLQQPHVAHHGVDFHVVGKAIKSC